jgi:hypothetical protein
MKEIKCGEKRATITKPRKGEAMREWAMLIMI